MKTLKSITDCIVVITVNLIFFAGISMSFMAKAQQVSAPLPKAQEIQLADELIYFDINHQVNEVGVNNMGKIDQNALPMTFILKNPRDGKTMPSMQFGSKSRGTNSFGNITDIQFQYVDALFPTNEHQISYKFKWHFKNSYNSQTGIADVTYSNIYSDGGYKSTVSIFFENKTKGMYFSYSGTSDWKPLTPTSSYDKYKKSNGKITTANQ